MRSEVEKQLTLIANGISYFVYLSIKFPVSIIFRIFTGQAQLSPVVDHALDIFKAKFLYFVKNITAMDELFEVSFSKFADGGKPFSRCEISHAIFSSI